MAVSFFPSFQRIVAIDKDPAIPYHFILFVENDPFNNRFGTMCTMGALPQGKEATLLYGYSTLYTLALTDPEKHRGEIDDIKDNIGLLAQGFVEAGQDRLVLQCLGPLSIAHLGFLRDRFPGTYLNEFLEREEDFKPDSLLPIKELATKFDQIIVLLGKRGSGKGTVSDHLTWEYAIQSMATSDWLRAITEVQQSQSPDDPIGLREVGNALRDQYGPDVLIRLTLQEQLLKEQDMVVLEGLRAEEELRALVEYPNVSVVWIEADDDVRLKRVRARNRPGDPKTNEDLLASDRLSFPEADKLKALCHHVLSNNSSVDEFGKTIDGLMGTLNIQKPRHSNID